MVSLHFRHFTAFEPVSENCAPWGSPGLLVNAEKPVERPTVAVVNLHFEDWKVRGRGDDSDPQLGHRHPRRSAELLKVQWCRRRLENFSKPVDMLSNRAIRRRRWIAHAEASGVDGDRIGEERRQASRLAWYPVLSTSTALPWLHSTCAEAVL